MADNTTINTGAGGDTIATDDIGGVKFQRVKLVLGADGVNDGDVSSANAMPVSDNGSSLTVDGTVAVSSIAAGTNNIGDVDVLTVPAPLSTTGGGTEATALRVTIASDSTGVVSIDDNSGSLTVDGTVAATQSGAWNVTNISGTVSLPTGAATLAEQQTQTTSLSVIDDWDESDRAKVNPIVGQAGIAAGAGAVGVTVPRVTLASDDPAVVALQILDNAISGSEMQVDVITMPTVTVNAHAVTNAGTFAVQVDGSALTALQLIDDTVFTDDAAFTPATSKVTAVGFLADETATDSVDEGDVGAARMTLDRKVHVAADIESNSMRISGVSVTPQFAAISGSTSGDNTLVPAVVGKKLRVISLFIVSAGTTTVRFESGAGGTALTGVMSLIANTGFSLPYNPAGWFQTAATNTLLNMELNAAVQVSGSLTYIEV